MHVDRTANGSREAPPVAPPRGKRMPAPTARPRRRAGAAPHWRRPRLRACWPRARRVRAVPGRRPALAVLPSHICLPSLRMATAKKLGLVLPVAAPRAGLAARAGRRSGAPRSTMPRARTRPPCPRRRPAQRRPWRAAPFLPGASAPTPVLRPGLRSPCRQ
ncbi:MAG: hypothetical protein J3K34DRAFT_403848 [Monoraphidium minutum]|nr:MAG: hypothetical protein J3K34DRAFT_403848 [Monoraphidium minutum]